MKSASWLAAGLAPRWRWSRRHRHASATQASPLTSGLLLALAVMPLAAAEPADDRPPWSERIQTVLDVARPLEFSRQGRLPLYLWPATNSGDLDDATAARLVGELDQRGVGLVSSWSPRSREQSLVRALRVGRAQQKLGLRVNVNASGCLHSFFNGDPATAHVDENGEPFWDESFNSGSAKHKMGCPFGLDSRKDPIRQQTEFFAKAYQKAGVGLDFAFVDWEIDGPIEFNRAHEASKRCTRCRENIRHIENFLAFQKPLREIRSELQRYAFTDPIKSRCPDVLIGNYAVYPHNGYRYWYDYFEYFAEGQPHLADQRAKYRLWANDFAATEFTCALPVAYTWYPTYEWYDFEVSDYRWFYNMLLVANNAGRHTPADVPVITFVHWHTTAPPDDPSPEVKQLSESAYQELLWHMLLRGTDTFFLWCPRDEDATEVRLVHEVYAAAQEYGQFLEDGTPVCFDVPREPGTVVSGLLLGDRLLVRRTDFGGSSEAVEIAVGTRKVTIEARAGEVQVLLLQ